MPLAFGRCIMADISNNQQPVTEGDCTLHDTAQPLQSRFIANWDGPWKKFFRHEAGPEWPARQPLIGDVVEVCLHPGEMTLSRGYGYTRASQPQPLRINGEPYSEIDRETPS